MENLKAVFEVKQWTNVDKPNAETITCVVKYVTLKSMTRGAAIKVLTEDIILQYKTSRVKFMFWCDEQVIVSGYSQVL